MERVRTDKKIDRYIVTHSLGRNEIISDMVLDIINKQEIPALAPVQIRRSLFGKKIRFVIEDQIDLRSYLRSDIRFDQFMKVVDQVVQIQQACDSYGIQSADLELDIDHVFYDHRHQQVRLLCWPLISLGASSDISAFLQQMGDVYTSRQQDTPFRMRYLQLFDSRAKFDPEAFRRQTADLLKQWQDERRGISSTQRSTNDTKKAKIYRIRTKTTIPITRSPFTLGRDPDRDLMLDGDPRIGKLHASISSRAGLHFLKDLGAPGGTFVGSARLPANGEVCLHTGDHFRVGNEEFSFIVE